MHGERESSELRPEVQVLHHSLDFSNFSRWPSSNSISTSLVSPVQSGKVTYSHAVRFTSWIKSERNQRFLQRWWIAITIVWECIRTLVVDQTFGKYGVNPYIYFALVMAIVIPYAIVTVRLLIAIVHRRLAQSLVYAFLAIVLHFAPDVYILVTADAVPDKLMDSFYFIVFVFAAIAIQGIIMKVRRQRRSALLGPEVSLSQE